MGKDSEIRVFINNANYSDKDQKQMINALNAFKDGKDQPEGRFKILGTLPKGK